MHINNYILRYPMKLDISEALARTSDRDTSTPKLPTTASQTVCVTPRFKQIEKSKHRHFDLVRRVMFMLQNEYFQRCIYVGGDGCYCYGHFLACRHPVRTLVRSHLHKTCCLSAFTHVHVRAATYYWNVQCTMRACIFRIL